MLSYKRDLWRLQRDKERTKRFYGNLITEAEKKNQSSTEIGHIVGEEMFHVDELDDQIIRLQI